MNTGKGQRDGFLFLKQVEGADGVVQTVCRAEKHPLNPLLPLGDVHEWDSAHCAPWSSQSIIYDAEERIFKAWYAGSDMKLNKWWATGYAISEDGVNWHKPVLGLHEYNGSTQNNIVHLGRGPVIKDTDEPDEARRYKGIRRIQGVTGEPEYSEYGARAVFSSDGIHWTDGAKIDPPEWGGRPPDVGVLVRDDQDPDPSRRFKTVCQEMVHIDAPHLKQKAVSERHHHKGRAKFLLYGPDTENFRYADVNPLISPNDGPLGEEEVHHVMMSPYRGDWIMTYEYGWNYPNGYGLYGMYGADIRLAASDDGETYTRVNGHQPLIARGHHTQWDSGVLVISDKPVVKDGKIYLFYGGAGDDFTSWPPENTRSFDWLGSGSGGSRVVRMGLATLREDGFTCMETIDRETPGYLTSVPIVMTDRETVLSVNVGDVRQNRSWIEVEVLDAETEEPIEGFSREDSTDCFVDGLQQAVSWGGRGISHLPADRFKIRFWIYGAARLYGYQFA